MDADDTRPAGPAPVPGVGQPARDWFEISAWVVFVVGILAFASVAAYWLISIASHDERLVVGLMVVLVGWLVCGAYVIESRVHAAGGFGPPPPPPLPSPKCVRCEVEHELAGLVPLSSDQVRYYDKDGVLRVWSRMADGPEGPIVSPSAEPPYYIAGPCGICGGEECGRERARWWKDGIDSPCGVPYTPPGRR